MIIKYTDFINESIDEKKSIIIRINTIGHFLKIKNDLEEWGFEYVDSSEDLEIENFYSINYYPIDLVIYRSPMHEFTVYTVNPDYDDIEDSDFYRYSNIEEFYDDTEVLNYVKNNGKILPDYNPRGINLRKI